MGTRSITKIEGIKFAALYIHWDGTPEHMLPWLESFNKRFTDERAGDPEYKFAQLLRDSAKRAEKFNLDNSDTTGYGIVATPRGKVDMGQDYTYTLKADGAVSYVKS